MPVGVLYVLSEWINERQSHGLAETLFEIESMSFFQTVIFNDIIGESNRIYRWNGFICL